MDVLTQLSIDGFYALDLAAIAVWAERARAAAGHPRRPPARDPDAGLVALAATLDGDTDSARYTSTSAANVVDVLPDDQFFEDPNVLGTRSTAEYFLDRYAEANDHVERALRIARASGRGQYVPLLYWSSSDPDLAERQAMAAVEAFAVAGAVLEAEKSRVLLGELWPHPGGPAARSSTSLAPVPSSRNALPMTCAPRSTGSCASSAAGTPPPRAPSPRDPLAPLSSREREVALLVADGKTNPQIAAELFLSGKTVESHVRHAFQELHVASRLELARLVDRSRAHDS